MCSSASDLSVVSSYLCCLKLRQLWVGRGAVRSGETQVALLDSIFQMVPIRLSRSCMGEKKKTSILILLDGCLRFGKFSCLPNE